MPAPFSEDLCQRIVYQYTEFECTLLEVAQSLRVSERTVIRVLDRWYDGEPLAGRTRAGVLNFDRLIGVRELHTLWNIVHETSEIYVDELADALRDRTGTVVRFT
jgi:hypothetical protein